MKSTFSGSQLFILLSFINFAAFQAIIFTKAAEPQSKNII
jgi:hypothetical protein